MTEPTEYSIASDRHAFEQWAHDSQPREPEDRAGEPGAAEIVRLLTASKDLRPASLGRHLLLLASLFGVGRAGQLPGGLFVSHMIPRPGSGIDLGLAILSVLRLPNQTLSHGDIAAWCDC